MKSTNWGLRTAAAQRLCRVRSLRPALAALVLIPMLSACASNSGGSARSVASHPAIARTAVVADVDAAIGVLSEIHPNLYWRTGPAEVARLKQELIAQLPESPSALDVYVTFMRLTAAFDDIHVAVASVPPQLNGADGKSVYDIYADAGGSFPAIFDPYSDALRVAAVPAAGRDLKAGDVIASVNGVSAAELLSRLAQLLPGGEATKRFEARREFGRMIWMLGINAPFQVTLAAASEPVGKTLTVQASTRQELDALSNDGGPDPIRYRLLEDSIGLIDFNDMTEPPDRFADRLVEIFERVKRDRPHGIVIDLRENGGGNSGLGDLLLAYVNHREYRPFAERHWKVSRGCQQWYQGYAEEERQYFLDYLAEQPGITLDSSQSPGRRVPSISQVYFGPVAALIGPGTNSSAMILADAMKTYGLARIFGEATTEPANMYGEVCQATLPNTGINITAPSALFIRANGDAASGDPILPDVTAGGSPDGAASDAALSSAREWLRSQAGT